MPPDRTHVRFAVFDFGPDPAVVTTALGIEPTRAWSAGDPFPGQPGHNRHDARWEIASALPTDATLEDQLDVLLDYLEAHRAVITQARDEFGAGILCAMYTEHNNPGLHLTGVALSRVAALGLSFDLDLYCLGSRATDAAEQIAAGDVRPGIAPE